MNRTTKIKITELNPHVICVLCGGYYINATTITECLHSFCRTCITRYLETSKYCPVCDVMVHKTRPLDYIRSDKTLQDLVYKLVPGLYKNEMKRRREYYAVIDTPGVSRPPSEDRGDEFHDRIIYTEDEKISLSLELCAEGIPFKTPINVHGHTGPENIRINDVRYLQCPAAFSIGNLKKFIRMKFDLKLKFEIDIFHTAEPLPEYYSLMDIAYIYTWTRRAPLRLYYTVFERRLPPKAPDPIPCDQATRTGDSRENLDALPVKTKADSKNWGKKRKLLQGPDDISPDLDFEKCRPHKSERRKCVATPKKRAKKALIDVDDNVNDAMSESEEQLARLTLDSSDMSRSVPTETGTGSEELEQTTGSKIINDNINGSEGHKENVKGVVKGSNKVNKDSISDSERLKNISVETNAEAVSKNSELVVNSNTDKDGSKQSSAQVSPGSGSITLSLFQPLNDVGIETNDKNTIHTNNDLCNRGPKSENLYDFSPDDTAAVAKKGRGRPKGSKNKVVSEKDSNKKKLKETVTSDGDENLVVSKNHPGLKSEKVIKTIKKKDSISSSNSPAKAKAKPGANKEASKTKPVNGDKPKRKYVRKNKPEGDLERESKRPKKDMSESEIKNISENSEKETETSVKITETHDKTVCPTEVKENIASDTHMALEKERTNPIEEGKETVHNTNSVAEENVNGRDREKPIPLNSVALQDSVTPLYGETPKVNESNQGLPCSPNMESLDHSGRLVIDTSVNSDDINGANTGRESDKTGVIKCKTNQSNGALCDSINVKNGDIVSNRALSKEIYKNSFVGFEMKQLEQSSRNSVNIPNTLGDPFRHRVNGLSSPLNMLSAFAQPSMNAYLHIDHVTGSVNDFTSHDQNFDQPLDLTSNGTREEYTKGKIFKTKMLKKTFPKQDSVNEKGSVNQS